MLSQHFMGFTLIKTGLHKFTSVTRPLLSSLLHFSLGTRPSQNRKGGSGKWAGVEVYITLILVYMQAHF